MKTTGRRTIHKNRHDNFYGYIGGVRVRAFGKSSTETPEQAAERWAAGDDTAGVASATGARKRKAPEACD